jgi:hypothetical protein
MHDFPNDGKVFVSGIQMHGGASDQAKAYTLAEVKAATNNFKNQIGEGGFGPVYTGRLPDGKEVAVKRCRPSNKHGTAEFANEVWISISSLELF